MHSIRVGPLFCFDFSFPLDLARSPFPIFCCSIASECCTHAHPGRTVSKPHEFGFCEGARLRWFRLGKSAWLAIRSNFPSSVSGLWHTPSALQRRRVKITWTRPTSNSLDDTRERVTRCLYSALWTKELRNQESAFNSSEYLRTLIWCTGTVCIECSGDFDANAKTSYLQRAAAQKPC